MSLHKSSNKNAFHQISDPDADLKPNYLRFNKKNSKAVSFAAIFAVNYVATVRDRSYDLNKTERMIWEKKLGDNDRKFHPVYLKFMFKEDKKSVNLTIQRMNSEVERHIIVSGAKIDSKTGKFFYLESIDSLKPELNRIHIFSIINDENLKNICHSIPNFGSVIDMHQHGYYLPNDFSEVLRNVQLYCLPRLGCHVSEMKEMMGSSLEKIFNNKDSITKISKRFGQIRTRPIFRESYCSDMNNSSKTANSDLLFNSKNIDDLMLENGNEKRLLSASSLDQKSSSNSDLPHSVSTQSSLNDESRDPFNPILCKFENLLYDERGLKYFKEFLTKEVSSENILFWEAIREFVQIENPELIKSKASEIFYTFMDENGANSVNLECDLVQQVRLQLNEPRADMFNAARNHIFYLMKTDSFNRFKKSNYFELWQDEYLNDSQIKRASSTSSLTNDKKRKNLLPSLFKSKKEKPKREESGKSSQTCDSDSSSSNLSSTCKITISLEYSETHHVPIQRNKKLIQSLKKIEKQFSENEAVAFDLSDNRIVLFSELMLNLNGREIIVEKSTVIRVGYVQVNMDINLYEFVWFVIRPRYHLCLSNAMDPIAKRIDVDLGQCVVIKQDDHRQISWDTEIHLLNKCSLFLIENNVFQRAKFYGKLINNTLEMLWKKIISPDSFLSSLPFDDDNVLDSRNDVFSRYKLEARKVGYIVSASAIQDDKLEATITRTMSYSYDDQRGICTAEQLIMPDFLKTCQGVESDNESDSSARRSSEVFFGDSDISFSDIDDFSDPSPSKLEIVSDFD